MSSKIILSVFGSQQHLLPTYTCYIFCIHDQFRELHSYEFITNSCGLHAYALFIIYIHKFGITPFERKYSTKRNCEYVCSRHTHFKRIEVNRHIFKFTRNCLSDNECTARIYRFLFVCLQTGEQANR